MVVIQSVIMDEDEDLEALRLAALQTIRPRVNPKKTQHNRQHAKGPFIRPSTNPNLIAIVPSEIAPVPIETTTTVPPPPSVVKPKQESPPEKIPKVVQRLPSTEEKDALKVDVKNVDSIVPKAKPAVRHDESGGFELEEDVLDFDTESLHESGEEDTLQLHDSDSDSLEKLMEDIEKELSTPAPAKIRPPRKQPDKLNINKAKSPPPKTVSTKAVSPPKINQSKPKSPIKIDPKPESPRPAVRENSPVRKRYSPIRQRTGSPIRQRGASPLRQRLASPSRQRMASPRQRPGSPRQRVASPLRRSPRRSPRRRSLSPRKRSLSPRKISPRRRSPSPRRRSPTPRKRSLSPRRRSLSPRRRSLTPRKRSLTPRKRSLSPRKRSISPRRRSITPRRRSLTPRKHSISPRRRSISPRRFTPRRFSPRRPSLSPRRRRSISPRRRSLSPWRSPRRRSPTPKRSPSPLRKRSPSPHHSPNKRKRIQSPPNSKRARPRQFQRGKQPAATNSNRPGNNPKGGYRGNRDVVDKKEEDRRVKGNSREREPVRSRDRATDTNEDEEKEPEPLNPKLEARKRKFENNYIIEAVNKKIRLKSERETSNVEQNRSDNNSGDNNTRGMRLGVDNGREEQLRENIARRLDRLEKGRTNRLEKVRNDLSKQDKPRSEPLRLEKPLSVEVSKAEKFRSENSRPDPLPNIVVRASAVELERESNIKLRTSKRKRIVLSEDKVEEERPRETTRLSENHALKNSTNLRRREVELEEIEEGEEEEAEEEEEEEERVVEKRKRKAPIKEKGGDLRAELSRRRAERMKGVSMDPMARIVQSAFEGVVGKMKSKSRASPPSDPEPVPNPPEKKEKSKPKGRRVFSVSKSSKTEDQSDDEDKTIGFPMHYRSAPNPSSSRTSGRSILRRNQV